MKISIMVTVALLTLIFLAACTGNDSATTATTPTLAIAEALATSTPEPTVT